MARQINVDLSNSIESWRNKTNLMSEYLGDLDDLTTDETSDLIASINSIEAKMISVSQSRLALSLNSIGSGSYASLGYDNSTGISTFEVSTLTQSDIPNLDAGKIATGTLSLDRIPALPASKITSGLIADARIPGLEASKTVAGVFNIDRIPTIPQSKIPGLEQMSSDVDALQIGLEATNNTERLLSVTGDISGQATFTNVGNISVDVTVVDDLHSHTISNVDGLEGRLSAVEGLESRLVDVEPGPSDSFLNINGGYQKFPSGLIIQWGRVYGVNAEQLIGVSLPIPFPSAFCTVMATPLDSRRTGDFEMDMYSVACNITGSRTSFTIMSEGTGYGSNNTMMWQAIGY